jgi:outer membrane protein TolC
MLFPLAERFEATWQVGVAATLNLGAFPAVERRVREAELEAEGLRARRQALALQVTMEVAESRESARRALERIASAAAAVERAGEALRVARGKVAAGLARGVELLDAELELMRARLEGTRAAADLRIAEAALRRAAGTR